MAINASSNLLLGAGHYEHHSHSQKIFTDPVMHLIENSHPDNHRASSVQSLQTISFSEPRPASISYSHFQDSSTNQVLSSTPSLPSNAPPISSSKHQDAPLNTSLCRIDNLCPSRISVTRTLTQDDSVSVVINKSSNECTNLTGTKAITSKNNENENENENCLIRKRPIEIRVRCIFSRVGEIDTLNERYTAEIFFEASWYDEDHKIGTKYDPQMGHFNPQLIILNHLGDSLKHEKWYSINKTDHSNIIEITEHHKIRGVFWERMELNHFPYDVQELSLSMTTPLTTDDIYFIENKQKLSGVNRIIFRDQQSWHLYEHVEFTYEQHREEYSLNYNQIHPVAVCTCHVGRKCGYYIWNAYFLIFLITSAALCTFAIPPSNTQGRLQITCTLLLTSVTFRWVVNKSLPTISYLTALDVYGISSIVALCIINVFHGIIGYFYYNQIYLTASQPSITTNEIHHSLYPEYSLCRLDRYAFFIFCSLFCLYQILILLCTMWIPYRRRRAMRRKDEKTRAKLINTTTVEMTK
ncbi:unnamed protein product [Rotaria sp. Silwood2]|nr:unnamed protein product [Rotaria sp. Silwood2]CAF2784693.1 unnamed protein product [Rotaria sp. Silwood2]CAF2929194.1 unnamed protein product [Rotaria sp. Silwood2]CAF3894863.1 unnamed protein product [Rotaria sp. Silwood2]CAF3989156.1 unnamed protein product [Rotaria sp. Silwood2]